MFLKTGVGWVPVECTDKSLAVGSILQLFGEDSLTPFLTKHFEQFINVQVETPKQFSRKNNMHTFPTSMVTYSSYCIGDGGIPVTNCTAWNIEEL